MINENHIIQFEYTYDLYKRLCINNDIYINEYKLSKIIIFGSRINIHYNNLSIYKFPFSRCNNYNYIFNISNMLYKIHNPNYYRKYNHKELI